MKPFAMATVAAVACGLVTTAYAADPRHPDWPCVQIMVPTLSVAAFWSGPPLEDVGEAWRQDPTVLALVQEAAARRTPIEEAEKMVGAFIAGTPAEKQKKGALLFAGLFATLNQERSQVMTGILRFAKRQQELRDKIRADFAQMRQQQDAPQQDGAADDKLGTALAWDTRVYDERRNTIAYVCEVPGTIERRLFALTRAIQQALE